MVDSVSDISKGKSEIDPLETKIPEMGFTHALNACSGLPFPCLRSHPLANYGRSIWFYSRILVMMSILFLKQYISICEPMQ